MAIVLSELAHESRDELQIDVEVPEYDSDYVWIVQGDDRIEATLGQLEGLLTTINAFLDTRRR